EAVAAFARQTGAACLSCHFQSFPTLNAFGRSFKKGSFTDVGDQALIEDDELSLPASLNITVVVRPTISSSTSAGVTTHAIQYADQVMLIGGRIGEHTGAFLELGGGLFGNAQFLNSFDVGDLKVGVNYFSTGFGEDAGLQLMSVWGQHGGLLGGKGISANAFVRGAVGATTGISTWVANDMGALTLGVVGPQPAAGADQPVGTFKLAPTLRAQSFFDVAGMELGLGAIIVEGQIGKTTPLGVSNKMSRLGIDVQLQGEMGDMPIGFYADYSSAKGSTATSVNLYNPNAGTMSGFSARATVKPVNNIVGILGFGSYKTGAVGATTDSTVMFGAEYEMYQNGVIALTYTSAKAAAVTTNTTLLDVEFLM
ncbi:MAG: hypothetical protein Q9M18_05925, partial [Mariprofundaceae bacterium]|nr:hypothetical protein [Mariprofundaceae bacterium]